MAQYKVPYHHEESLVVEQDEDVTGGGGGEGLQHSRGQGGRRGGGERDAMQPFQPSCGLGRHVLPITTTYQSGDQCRPH